MIVARGLLVTLSLVALLYSVLTYLYVVYVHPSFAAQYHLDFDGARFGLGLLLAVVTGAVIEWSTRREWRPSRVVVYLLFVGLILPLQTLIGLRGESIIFILVCTIALVLMGVCLKVVPPMRVRRPQRAAEYFMVVSVICIGLYVYTSLLVGGGLGRVNFDFTEVYDVREEYHASASFFMGGYFVPWTAYVINSILLCLALYYRRRFLVLVVIVLQALLFGMTNFKSFLFAPILIVVLYFVSEKRSVLNYLLCGAVAAVVLSYGWYIVTGDHMWSSIAIRRQFFAPANIHLMYYDWFSSNPKVMLSNSILSGIVENPYSERITRVISWEYYGRDGGPNVGLYGNAYSHFGYWGIGVFSLLLTAVLLFVDGLAKQLPSRIVLPVVGITSMALVNSALFTVLATHGLLLSILCLWALMGRVRQIGLFPAYPTR